MDNSSAVKDNTFDSFYCLHTQSTIRVANTKESTTFVQTVILHTLYGDNDKIIGRGGHGVSNAAGCVGQKVLTAS